MLYTQKKCFGVVGALEMLPLACVRITGCSIKFRSRIDTCPYKSGDRPQNTQYISLRYTHSPQHVLAFATNMVIVASHQNPGGFQSAGPFDVWNAAFLTPLTFPSWQGVAAHVVSAVFATRTACMHIALVHLRTARHNPLHTANTPCAGHLSE